MAFERDSAQSLALSLFTKYSFEAGSVKGLTLAFERDSALKSPSLALSLFTKYSFLAGTGKGLTLAFERDGALKSPSLAPVIIHKV